MAVSQAKFNEGMTYEQALEKMPRNKPQIEKNEGLVKLTTVSKRGRGAYGRGSECPRKTRRP